MTTGFVRPGLAFCNGAKLSNVYQGGVPLFSIGMGGGQRSHVDNLHLAVNVRQPQRPVVKNERGHLLRPAFAVQGQRQ